MPYIWWYITGADINIWPTENSVPCLYILNGVYTYKYASLTFALAYIEGKGEVGDPCAISSSAQVREPFLQHLLVYTSTLQWRDRGQSRIVQYEGRSSQGPANVSAL